MALGAIAAPLLLWWLTRERVEVGADGIWIRGLRAQFIPRTEIESVRAVPWMGGPARSIEITKAKGKKVSILPPSNPLFGGSDVDALVRRIEEVRALAPSGAHLRNVRTLLARGERSIPEWLMSLRELGLDGRNDYRVAHVDPNDLRALVRDGSLGPDVRAAAAIALRAGPSPDGAKHVGVAAAACASPELRICLDSIAESTDDEVIATKLSALQA